MGMSLENKRRCVGGGGNDHPLIDPNGEHCTRNPWIRWLIGFWRRLGTGLTCVCVCVASN